MSLITTRGRHGRTAVRALALSAAASASLIGATAAHAAAIEINYSATFQPMTFNWDGGGAVPTAGSTGSAYVGVDQSYTAPNAIPFCHGTPATDYAYCSSHHLRGGVEIKNTDANDNPIPVSVLPGDVLQSVAKTETDYDNNAPGTVVASAAIPAPQPVIASVIGSNTATIGRAPDAGYVDVIVRRRVVRQVDRDRVIPGSYSWTAVPSSNDDSNLSVKTCYPFNAVTQSYDAVPDTAPDRPTADPGAGNHWLRVGTQCRIAEDQIQGAPFEYLMQGRLTAVTDTAYAVTFPQPLAAGDVLDYTQITESLVNDVHTSFTLDNIVPVGTVPPPPPADVTPPKVQSFDFGASTVSVKTFKKSGLLTFIALDEPSTVSEQLTATPVKEKKKKGKKKKSKASTAAVVIATGSGATTGPGQTARVPLSLTPAGSKLLKSYKGKPVHATLITTVTDKSGNKVASTSTYTITG